MPTWSTDTIICKSFSDPDQRILAAVCKNAIEVLGWLHAHKCWHRSPSEMSEIPLQDCLLRCSEDSIEGKFDLDNPPSLDDMQGEASAWVSGATERLFETLNAVTGSEVGYREIIRGAISFSNKLTK